MPDIFSKPKRSEIMSRIRSKNTKPEVLLRKLVSSSLYPLGYRYRINYKNLPGSPDPAFVSKKVAVFVDGVFWHGYNFQQKQLRLPKGFWVEKIRRNMRRDKRVNRQLRRLGWSVVRIWEHDVYGAPDRVLRRIKSKITPNA